MSNVIFDEAPLSTGSGSTPSSGLIGFLMRHRVAKTQSQAQTMLLIVTIIILVVAVVLAQSSFSGNNVDSSKNLVPAIPSR